MPIKATAEKRLSSGNVNKERGRSKERTREKSKKFAERVYSEEWPRGNKGHMYQKLQNNRPVRSRTSTQALRSIT